MTSNYVIIAAFFSALEIRTSRIAYCRLKIAQENFACLIFFLLIIHEAFGGSGTSNIELIINYGPGLEAVGLRIRTAGPLSLPGERPCKNTCSDPRRPVSTAAVGGASRGAVRAATSMTPGRRPPGRRRSRAAPQLARTHRKRASVSAGDTRGRGCRAAVLW